MKHFMEDDFEKADHIDEIRRLERRKSPRCQCGPDLPGTCPGPDNCPHSDRYDQFANVPAKGVTYHRIPKPLVKCGHEWPEGDRGTDINGCCVKCGMSFMLYIHSECP